MRLWIDADACPRTIKEIIYKASARLKIPVSVVANSQMSVPRAVLISMVVVGKGQDVADHHIVDSMEKGDLVVTADIPLAAQVVDKGGIAINPRGEVYSQANVSEILSMRNFMDQMRSAGLANRSGPSEFGRADEHKFAASLDRLLAKKIKEISTLSKL